IVVYRVRGAIQGDHSVLHGRRRRYESHVVLSLESLLDDLEMQQAEETGTKTEAQSLRGLGLVEERGVVEPELLERVLELRIVLGVRGIEAREDHRLRRTVARQRLRGGSRRERERISDAAIGHRFQTGRDVTHLAGDETLD